jgi:WD40 repeat protein
MTAFRAKGSTKLSGQGMQQGNQNLQYNYFAPVTQNLFRGSFERLRDVCFEPAVLERDLDLAHFTGREWLIKQIDNFIATRRRGYVIVQAEAGVGKSSLAAHLVWTRPWVHHFTRLPGGRSPEAARKSLAAQLIAQWELEDWAPDGIMPASADQLDWFDRLLLAAAERRDVQKPDEPIVLVVDGLDEAEASAIDNAALPLGLPASLPDGVYVVATSRFGIDRSLHPVRNPADWQQIEVDGADNLEDMRRFIDDITDPNSSDRPLATVIQTSGVNLAWLRRTLAKRCGGVWIYLRYVLDEIRDGMREASQVDRLPADLAGYYAQQIERWRGDSGGMSAGTRWKSVTLPLLAVLGAARSPFTGPELASFAGVEDLAQAREFLEETARAFLNRRQDSTGLVEYSVRHQSLRDLISGALPDGRPDLKGLADLFIGQAKLAHQRITIALTPAGTIGEREWQDPPSYIKDHLAAHAAACGMLDKLVTDLGFLIVATPEAVLAQRRHLQTLEGKCALAALGMSLSDWEECGLDQRVERIAANAARLNVASILSAYALMTSSDWPIRWAAWSGYVHQSLAGHLDWVNAVAVGRAAGREVIVSGADDFTVRLWDATNGDPIGDPLVGHKGIVNAVAIGRAADRDLIVSGSHDGTIRLWDAATGEPIGNPLTGHSDWVNAVAIGRSGTREVVVSGSEDDTIRVWDANNGRPIGGPFSPDGGGVTAVTIGRVENRGVIVFGSAHGDVGVWDAATDTSLLEYLNTHCDVVTSVAIGRAADQDVIVAGSDDGDIQVWNAITGDPVNGPMIGHKALVTSVAIGRAWERDVIVSGSDDGEIRIWDAATGVPTASPITGHDGSVSSVAVSRADGRDVIVSGSHDGTVRIWDDPASGALKGHTASVNSAVIGRVAGRNVIVSGSDDQTVRIWDAARGTPVGVPLLGHTAPVNSVAIGQVAGREVIVSGAREVQIWDAVRGGVILALTGHDALVNSVAIGRVAGRDVIVSGSDDQTVRIWDAVRGTPVGVPLLGHTGPVNSVAIGQVAGRDVIVSGSDDQTAAIWDAATCQQIGDGFSAGVESGVCSVAIGRIANEDVLAAGHNNGELWIWGVTTGYPASEPWADHDRAVNAVAIGHLGNNDVIASASADRTLLLRASAMLGANPLPTLPF